MNETLKTGLVFSPDYLRHETPPSHPESYRRAEVVMKSLEDEGLTAVMKRLQPKPALKEDVTRCHSHSYFAVAKEDVERGASSLSTGDTDICGSSFEVALLAAGGVMAGVDAVIENKVQNAFCVVRPPGHHATPNKGMGFCVFNNIAIGARHAQAKHKVGKVLIADFDVHHGNGTQAIFYEDETVLFFDCHQSPWYPGTGDASEIGTGKGLNCTINCPFPAGSGRAEVLGAFEGKLVEAAEKFKPDLVMLSAGFDSRAGDPLGHFQLTDEDFKDLTKVMLHIARQHANGRLVTVLEGGYNLRGLMKASAAHARTLLAG
ncbi:MAG TPA: histone deacetylase [Verrucomicrobiae bacterium]|nr:histone deacetylase [Verrucomicrobiae bacterium]